MKIEVISGIEDAMSARGLCVAIDLFRATSTICYTFGAGARAVIPVLEVEEARLLKEEHPDYVLMGERDSRPPPGFDYGNSPAEIEKADLTGKTVIHTTTTGTRGIVKAAGDELITGSFANFSAVLEYIGKSSPEIVSILALGGRQQGPAHEDSICAEFFKKRLSGEPSDFTTVAAELRAHPSASKFFDTQMPWVPERDLDLCLSLDSFDFVVRREKSDDGLWVLRKIRLP